MGNIVRLEQYWRKRVSMVDHNKLALVLVAQPKYVYLDVLDNGKVGVKGCQDLSKAQWNHLNDIYLCRCIIYCS